jgi:hypothetical protein
MSRLLAGLAISIGISIGPLAASLSVNTKGQVNGDVSYLTRNYARGAVGCLLNCDPNYSDGTGSYRGVTVGQGLQTRTKVYQNGAMSADLVISEKVCNKGGVFCVKGAVSKRLVDNFERKEDFIPHQQPLGGTILKPGVVNPNSLPSYAVNGRTWPLQSVTTRGRFSNLIIANDANLRTTQSQRNKWTKKRGKQLYEILKAGDPRFRGL